MKPCGENCQCTIFHQETLTKVEKALHPDAEYQALNELFKVFSDLTRIKILEAIKDDQLCVCDLSHLVGISKSAVSHQMTYLKKYHLVKSAKVGKMVYYSLNDPHAIEIIQHAYSIMKGQQAHA
ncbi:MAG: ArsR family transcriptional regulator [Acholeplasma sp.]|jgi:DNA-binding transcriptional ArsR family regulator|nr:MAG: ArsR family transcriptional regulator [Acholeplasma sp.]